MKFTLFALLTVLASSTNAARFPGADTPLFYLVSTSRDSASNLLPLRTNDGADGDATLTGSGPIGEFHFFQGKFAALSPHSPGGNQFSVINSLGASCTTYGSLGFSESPSQDKCARSDTFGLESNSENSQLGAKLTLNSVGGFYACGDNRDVFYQVSPGDVGLSCSAIDLYTVPVA